MVGHLIQDLPQDIMIKIADASSKLVYSSGRLKLSPHFHDHFLMYREANQLLQSHYKDKELSWVEWRKRNGIELALPSIGGRSSGRRPMLDVEHANYLLHSTAQWRAIHLERS